MFHLLGKHFRLYHLSTECKVSISPISLPLSLSPFLLSLALFENDYKLFTPSPLFLSAEVSLILHLA